jgi:hypothetical protein
MAAKGQASKSATGASMSKYDVEVESRLQKLEAAVAKLQADSHPDRGGDSDTKGVQEQLDALTAFMESARRRL